MKKRISAVILSALLCLCALASMCGEALAAQTVTDPGKLRGADYTDLPVLAARLDGVFGGEPAMYSDILCRERGRAEIGSRAVPLGRLYYVKSPSGFVYSGTSCYIYANAVYSALFGDVPYHGADGDWSNSRRVTGPMEGLSYDALSALGVRCGALLRTTGNRDGSYNGERGHSIIILKYGSAGITYLEGNADGRGLIRVTERTWEEANRVLLTNRGYKVSFIVQPTEDYYAGLGAISGTVGRISRVREYDGRFGDVGRGDWFAPWVASAYSFGLLDGRSRREFSPQGSVTRAEGVAMAAKFLSRYYDDRHDFSSTGPWYGEYYAYMALWGAAMPAGEPEGNITRGEFALLLAGALPEEAWTARSGDIDYPDVSPGAGIYSAVELLTRCGVTEGAGGYFRPDSELTRAEAAAMLARMADRGLRLQ